MNQCTFCGKETVNPKFCSRSCTAKMNNSKYPKRYPEDRFCIKCGVQISGKDFDNRKYHVDKKCAECRNLENTTFLGKSTMDMSLTLEQHEGRLSYTSKLRGGKGRITSKTILRGIENPNCCVCGFNHVVELAHIIPIKEFPKTATMGEVNSSKNLATLCPNHHALLDKGFMFRWEILSINDQYGL